MASPVLNVPINCAPVPPTTSNLPVGLEPVGGSTSNTVGSFTHNLISYRMYRFAGGPQAVGTTGTFKVSTCT